ncbi:long-chain-fatty-acid--CoA ligase [Azospirillum halopraeferens]|uniref:long-chain-fatty-acid--CoA ligase n=1 Tax=Azospirillum halopraeferens TaxID=34010 RepID=UPI000491CD64|nr:long-chain fatty acid--CoA ligase [Azospirillum halopraeferens]
MDSVEATAAGRPRDDVYPQGVDWNAAIPVGPVPDLLEEAAARFADHPCIDFLGKRYTYAETAGMVDRVARGLQILGLRRGDRVGILLPNTPYFIFFYFGILKAGGIVVNCNPLYAERELEKQIADAGIELLVTLDLTLLYAKAAPMFGRTGLKRLVICPMAGILPWPKNWLFPIVRRKDRARIPADDRHVPFARVIDNDGRPAPVVIDPQSDVALLQYTGGTTGIPKGAMLTHANVCANARQCTAWIPGARPGAESVLVVLPLFHVFAMTVGMNMAVALGAKMILLPRFDLEEVMRTLHAKRPTMFPAVPTIYTAVANHKDAESYDLSSIRFCVSGGAPLPVEVKAAFERRTGCVLTEGYGLTESSPVVTINPLDGVNKAGSIGLPLPGTVIEIVSLEDGRTVLPPGEKGELCVRGPQVMKGYWNRPDETATTLADGRLHTGDVAVMDGDGYTFIVDRIKDMILCSGFNVYPRNVEEAIYMHPAVVECIVAGVPDPYRGQTVKAYVTLTAGATLTREELTAFLKDKLSPIEMPKLLEIRDTLPRTMVGKLSRKALLDEEEARRSDAA